MEETIINHVAPTNANMVLGEAFLNVCLVSGGKDSQATAIHCQKNKIENLKFLFCDTQWEDSVTYDFLKDFETKLGSEIIRLSSIGFVALAKKKKRFPSTKGKFCTEELKVKPMIDFILSQETSIRIHQGIRWEESANRASMLKKDDFFKFYFEPYGYDKKGKPKRYSYRKKDIVEWLKKYSCEVDRPIISWTTKEVFAYIIDSGFMPNKLYQYNFTRVGCFPCIMCTKDEIAKIAEYRPDKITYIETLEKEMNSTFFPPEYIPMRFCSKIIEVKDKVTGLIRKVGIASVMDVVKYVQGKQYGSGLFTGSSCQNHLLPCE